MLARQDVDRFGCQRRPCLMALAMALLLLGCESSTEPPRALSASISPTDTTIFAGDALTFEALAEYESGPAAPDMVVWVVRDPRVLNLQAEEDYRVTVTGSERGSSSVIATINETFVDSALVQVVVPGDIRWQAQVAGRLLAASGPALDGPGRVFVSHSGSGGQDWLSSFTADGESIFSVHSCSSRLSPGV